MYRIGVTGGTGFIGQYLLRENLGRYCFVVLTSGSRSENMITHDSISYIRGDYSEYALKTVFDGCDCIVHLGAKRSNAENEKAFINYIDNIKFSEAVFRAGRDLGIKNIVNISSTAVYDNSLTAPFSEDMAVDPISFYGVSKRAIELIASMYNKRFNMCIKSLRLAQVIGEGERTGYILSVFKDLCREGRPLSVYGEGKNGKEYIYIKDVVDAITAAVEEPDKLGIYNIGTGRFTSNRELAEVFCRVYENKSGYKLLTDKPDLENNYFMDVSLAEKELGFVCRYDLETSVREMKKMSERTKDE